MMAFNSSRISGSSRSSRMPGSAWKRRGGFPQYPTRRGRPIQLPQLAVPWLLLEEHLQKFRNGSVPLFRASDCKVAPWTELRRIRRTESARQPVVASPMTTAKSGATFNTLLNHLARCHAASKADPEICSTSWTTRAVASTAPMSNSSTTSSAERASSAMSLSCG